jgi:hypothetical protein
VAGLTTGASKLETKMEDAMKKNTRLTIDFNMGLNDDRNTAEEREAVGRAIEHLMETIYAVDGTAVCNLEEN